jgi:WD40 repeat protein
MLEPGAILQDRYKIVGPIGKGGMGSVYRARDLRLRTDVALKETHFADEAYRRAFEQEAQILARLRHPTIPRVIDHFIEEQGQFLVMEFIHGEDLGNQLLRLAQRFASPQAMPTILRWADQLLDALTYLHTRSVPVYHRDIKPKNLKLTPSYEIILLDFGLARGGMTVSFDLNAATTAPSEQKKIYGYTPPYAPIEQMRDGEPDARSDLYSLAATTYHLLTASLPVDAMIRMAKLINGQPDPLRPIRELAPHVPEPVAELLQRALAVTIDGRPRSAREMREELARVRSGNTPSSLQRPAAAIPAAEPASAAQAVAAPPVATPPVEGLRASPTPFPGAITPSSPRPAASAPPAVTPLRLLNTGSPIRTLAFSPDGELLAAGYDHTVGMWRLGDFAQTTTLKGHTSSVRSVRFAPGGTLASASDDETVQLWQASDGALRRQLRVPGCSIESVAFSPAGDLMAVGGWGGSITLCEIDAGSLNVRDSLPAPFIHSLSFSPDGALLAAGGYDGSVYLWALPEGGAEEPLSGFSNFIYSVAFSPDGQWLAASSGSSVQIWRLDDRKPIELLQGHSGPVHSIAFSPDSSLLASASEDKTVQLWRALDWTATGEPLQHRAGVAALAYSPDGATIAAGCHDGRICLWSVE